MYSKHETSERAFKTLQNRGMEPRSIFSNLMSLAFSAVRRPEAFCRTSRSFSAGAGRACRPWRRCRCSAPSSGMRAALAVDVPTYRHRRATCALVVGVSTCSLQLVHVPTPWSHMEQRAVRAAAFVLASCSACMCSPCCTIAMCVEALDVCILAAGGADPVARERRRCFFQSCILASSLPTERTCRVARPAAVRVRRLPPQGARDGSNPAGHRACTRADSDLIALAQD